MWFHGPMALLLLVRHGESTWNADGRWQGWADPPLSGLGQEQAREAIDRLRPLGFTSAYASDLQRAVQTATILAEGIGLGPVRVVPGLRERNVGDWSGLTTTEVEAGWPGMIAAWRSRQIASPPGGEENRAFADRVEHALRDVAAGVGDAGPALVVAHGGVVRALERRAGEEALTLPNLGGRWFDVEDGQPLRAGTVVRLTDPETPAAAPVF